MRFGLRSAVVSKGPDKAKKNKPLPISPYNTQPILVRTTRTVGLHGFHIVIAAEKYTRVPRRSEQDPRKRVP